MRRTRGREGSAVTTGQVPLHRVDRSAVRREGLTNEAHGARVPHVEPIAYTPDAFVVFGVENRQQMSYKVWEEGKGPDFVLEVASPNT